MFSNSRKNCLYRRALAVILSAAMVVGILTGIVPGTSITAEATSHSRETIDFEDVRTGDIIESTVKYISAVDSDPYDQWYYDITFEAGGYIDENLVVGTSDKDGDYGTGIPLILNKGYVDDLKIYPYTGSDIGDTWYVKQGVSDSDDRIILTGIPPQSEATISFAKAKVKKSVNAAVFTNTLTNTGNGTVSYSVNEEGEAVAEVNSKTGEVTIKGVGTAIISATVEDTDKYTYKTKTVSYELIVSETEPEHDHIFAYAQGEGDDANKITAKCTAEGDCKYKPDGITISLNAPESLVYDGTAKEASISGYPETEVEGLAAKPTITYSDGSGSAISSAPVNVGKYSANMTWGEVTVSKAFEITKRPITITSASHEWEYDGQKHSDPSVSVTEGSLADGDTLDAQATGEVKYVSDYVQRGDNYLRTYSVKHGEADVTDNYSISVVEGKLKINPRKITLTAPSKEWTYDGTDHTDSMLSVTSGSLLEGDYISGGATGSVKNVTDTAKDNNPVSDEIKIKHGSDDMTENYDIAKVAGTLTITPAPVTITAKSEEFSYDGNAHSNSGYDVIGLVGDNEISATVEGSITFPSQSPVDNVVKTYQFVKGTAGNYSVTTVKGALTMKNSKNDITIKAADDEWFYDGNTHTSDGVEIKEGALFEGDTLVATATGSVKDVSDTKTGNNVVSEYKIMHGDEDVTASYNVTTVPGTLKIKKKTLTIKAASYKFVYNGTAQSDNVYYTIGKALSDEVEATVSGSITFPSQSPVKNKVVSYKFTKGKAANYIISVEDGELLMSEASQDITITAGSSEWTYDGQAHSNSEVTVTSGKLFEGDELVANATGSVTDVSDTTEGNNPIADGYKIMHGDVDVTDNYNITTEAGTLTINKRPLTITAEDEEFTYDGTAKNCDKYVVSGLIGEDSVSVVTSGSITFPDESPVDNEIESYQFVKGTPGNYDVTTVDGKLTMNNAEAEITLASADGVWPYDGKAHDDNSVELFSGKLFTGDSIVAEASGSVTNVDDTKEGNNPIAEGYQVMHGDKDVTDNYKITTKAGTLTITPIDASITAESEKFVYDGATHSNSNFKVDGLINDDELTATVGGSITYPDEGTVVNKITNYEFTTGKACNYNITTIDGELTMEKAAKAITITAASNKWTYDGQAHSDNSVSITSGELFIGDQLSAQAEGSVTNVNDTEEGNNVVKDDYVIMHNNVDVTDNYVVTTEAGTLTIDKAEAVIKTEPVANDLEETGEKQALIQAGSTDDGSMMYALGTDEQTVPTEDKWRDGIPTGKDAGTYYVWYKVIGDENHNDSEAKEVTVTVAAKDVPIDPDDPDDPGKKDDPAKYKNEWVNGQWYDANGKTDYAPKGSWKQNANGWWYEDTSGWYPVSCWQKIDGTWYYFRPDGYMASNEYYNGYWLNSDGSWDDKYFLSWKQNSTGWWVEDISGWWPASQWLKIDGYWYYFDASGYMV